MRRLLLLLLPLLAACQPTLPARPDQVASPPLQFQVPQVEQLTLANGMRLYLKEDHELPLVEVTVMVDGGAIGDPPEKTGQSELFGVLLRTGGVGGRTPEQVDAALERMAADFSVATDTYATSLSLSLLKDNLDEGLALLADTLRRPRFDAQRLVLARQQKIEAIRRQNDRPAAIASRLMMQAIYGDHPLGRTPTEATVKTVTVADLSAFHRDRFHPGSTWIAVSGDFDRAALLSLLERLFGDWPQVAVAPQPLPPVLAETAPQLQIVERDLPQSVVLIGQLGVDKSAPDLQAVRLMNYILGGGGFNSRLMREIRSDRGLAYSVYSYYQVGRRLPGPFLAQSETKCGSTLEVVRLMREQIERMRTVPVDEAELHQAKESLINSFVFAFSDSHEVVTQELRLDFYGYPPGYLENLRAQIAAVTVADVQRAAQQHLDPARLRVVLVGASQNFDGSLTECGLPVQEVQP